MDEMTVDHRTETPQETFYHHNFVWAVFGGNPDSLLRYYQSHSQDLQDGLHRRFDSYPPAVLEIPNDFWGNTFQSGITQFNINRAKDAITNHTREVMAALRSYYSEVGARILTYSLGTDSALEKKFPEICGLVERLEKAFGKDVARRKL
ncbi:hypothetical protein HYU13_03440, partial [Candidatus Woesearchaeota archaeon]|nr:hypothetical protein [Candidatus Woesearchaeota archaeon]